MKKVYLLNFVIFFISIDLISDDHIESIKIQSDRVEFIDSTNKVNFLRNVNINSDYIEIKASSAIYDDESKTFIISGMPSKIKSSRNNNLFDGVAEEILFFNDEKVHLIGNATMRYENISISSDLIIFNPKTGKISSE